MSKFSLSGLFAGLVKTGSQTRDALDSLGAEINAVRQRLADVEAAPVGSDAVATRVAEIVDAAGREVRAGSVGGLLSMPPTAYKSDRAEAALSDLSAFDLAALIDPAGLKRALAAEAAAASSDFGGKPLEDSERSDLRNSLTAELLRLEVSSERIARHCEGQGLGVSRHRGASPAVLLAHDAELEAAVR